jgi:hypothetical protein
MTNNDMPTPKSSNEANTTKVFTPEMVKNLSIAELDKLHQEGWDYEEPIRGKDWRELMPDDPYAFKAEGHDKANEVKSNFVAQTQKGGDPEVAKANADPRLQKLAGQLGTNVNDLLLFREMMLDRHGEHYQDDDA